MARASARRASSRCVPSIRQVNDTGVVEMRSDPAWKSALLHKSQEVADLLDAVLSGETVELTSLPAPTSPDQSPEVRLRSFLEQIERAIKAFDSDAFGRCE